MGYTDILKNHSLFIWDSTVIRQAEFLLHLALLLGASLLTLASLTSSCIMVEGGDGGSLQKLVSVLRVCTLVSHRIFAVRNIISWTISMTARRKSTVFLLPNAEFFFSCGHVWMWELDCEEGWAPKTWCFWTLVLEKALESPLDCKEIQPVHSKGDQPRDFFGRNDAKAESPVLWPPHAKSWLIGKDYDAGRDWGQEEKGTTEDEMAGWHHWLDGRESQWTPGAGDGQGGLACCDSWGRKESDTTERLI